MDMIDKRASTPENESDNITNDVSSQASSTTPVVIDLEIQDIEGVGPTTARKLKEAGIVSVMDLAVTSSDEFSCRSQFFERNCSDLYNGSPATVTRV